MEGKKSGLLVSSKDKRKTRRINGGRERRMDEGRGGDWTQNNWREETLKEKLVGY